jgi:protein TonB
VAPIFASNLPDPLQIRQVTFFELVPPPEPPPPARVLDRSIAARPDVAPVEMPPGLAPEIIVEPPPDPGAFTPGVVTIGSLPPAADHGIVAAPPPVPAPVAPVRVGGTIRTPQKIVHVPPEYPRVAIEARIKGVVILEAVLDEQGSVRGVRVLRSIPLLDQAAVDAVRQWRYTPTLLNGVPVPIVMTVTVSFDLAK